MRVWKDWSMRTVVNARQQIVPGLSRHVAGGEICEPVEHCAGAPGTAPPRN
jgi:hypothetical protein